MSLSLLKWHWIQNRKEKLKLKKKRYRNTETQKSSFTKKIGRKYTLTRIEQNNHTRVIPKKNLVALLITLMQIVFRNSSPCKLLLKVFRSWDLSNQWAFYEQVCCILKVNTRYIEKG